jgi:MinD-like ATPase involved in chromosome partitioning or flagellar assembly
VGAQLAAAGKRVAVVDTDIQSPGIHVLFGFSDDLGNTLNDYLWGKIPIKDAALDVTDVVAANATIAPGGALFLVPSSMKAADIARVLREGYDVDTLNDGFRDLARDMNLDYLLIDTHPGLNEETLLSITISDILLLILRPDRQDFQGTAVTVDVARRLGIPTLLLVVNKVPTGIDIDDLGQQMTATYDSEVAAILPLAEEVVQNASAGLFSLTSPDHPWSAQIRKIADRVIANG